MAWIEVFYEWFKEIDFDYLKDFERDFYVYEEEEE